MMDIPRQPSFLQPPPKPSQGRSIASLVLGILSLGMWICPLVGLAVSVPGLMLGCQGRSRKEGGMATAGIILSTIGLLLTVINLAYGAYLGATGQHPLVNQIMQRPTSGP